MEASDLIGTQWTCPQCKTNEVINASGIDHKCSNYHVIIPLDKLFIRYVFFKGMLDYEKAVRDMSDLSNFLAAPSTVNEKQLYAWTTKAAFDFEKYRGHVPLKDNTTTWAEIVKGEDQ